MAQKKFNTQNVTDKFFAQDNNDAQNNNDIQTTPKAGRPKKEKPLRGYRYALMLDSDLDPFLHEIVWVKRTSMTQYVNDIIREKKNEYVKECLEKGVNPYEGWEEENETEYR